MQSDKVMIYGDRGFGSQLTLLFDTLSGCYKTRSRPLKSRAYVHHVLLMMTGAVNTSC